MAEQYAPIAKDSSLNTTDLTPKNIADVLQDGLATIANSVKIKKTTNTYSNISAGANASTWVANIGLAADNKVYSITSDNSNCMCYMATAGVNVQLYVRNFSSSAQTVNITVNALS